jgi:hypothetical protein
MSTAALLLGLSGAAALAQTESVDFRLTPSKSNPTSCTTLDASLSRVHTVTLMGEKAHIKSAGGVNDDLKAAGAQVYKTNFSLGGVTLQVTANAGAKPRSLQVVEPKLGCKWDAITP